MIILNIVIYYFRKVCLFVVSDRDADKFYGVVKESIQLHVHFSLENRINVGLCPSHRPFY